MSQTVLFGVFKTSDVCLYICLAGMVISMWQTSIQDEDIILTTPNASLPPPLLKTPSPLLVPHP